MKILVITATRLEAKILIEGLRLKKINDNYFISEEFNTDLLIAGVGIPATIFSMFTHNKISTYDLIINCGIAGSFSETYSPGTLVNVYSDYFGDIGFNSVDGFINIFKMNFNDMFINMFNNGLIVNTSDYPSFFHNIQKVKAVTVNIPENKISSDADIETMEGAAFMMVCKHFKKNFIQIRAVSNIIGKTKREGWDFKDSICNYSKIISKFIILINSK